VHVVDRWLDDRPRAYRLALARYRRDTDRAIRTFSWFIYRFTSPVMRDRFSTPRNILGAEQAVISMLAGDVYRTGLVRLKLAVFQALYGIGVLLRPSVASLHRHGRLAAARDQEPFG
jgi:hypothetical protein